MKFYVNVLVATLLLPPSFSVNADSESGGDFEKFNQIVETSADSMGKCIEIVNKLEVLRAELVMLLKGINLSAAGVNDSKNPQTVKTIISNIKMICKLLQTAISDKPDNGEKAKEVADNMESAESEIIEKYESTTKILVGLHDKIYKTILKFNLLHTEIEDLMSNITHDLRNINMPLNTKEEKAGKLKEKLKELKADVKTMLPELDEGIDKCKEHIDAIEQKIEKGENKKGDKQKKDDTKKEEDKKSDDKEKVENKGGKKIDEDKSKDESVKKDNSGEKDDEKDKQNKKNENNSEKAKEKIKSDKKNDKNEKEKPEEKNRSNKSELEKDSDSKKEKDKKNEKDNKNVKDNDANKGQKVENKKDANKE